MKLAFCALAILVGVSFRGMGAESGEYPHPNLLIEPVELAKPEMALGMVILDARSRAVYDREHLSGARWVDHEGWRKAFAADQDVEAWSKRIGELGIGPATKVVVYDDARQKDAARVWWILRYFGAEDVRLLNGGWKGWKAAGLPTSDQASPSAPAVVFPAQPHTQWLTTMGQLRDALKQRSWQIVDARSEAEYCGIEAPQAKRAGSIPGAKLLEWSDLVDSKTDRFRSPEQLRQLFADAGIDLAQPTVTYCQSGGRASVMAFGMELMGASEVRNYYRSWSEWGNDPDTPIVVPERPKKAAK